MVGISCTWGFNFSYVILLFIGINYAESIFIIWKRLKYTYIAAFSLKGVMFRLPKDSDFFLVVYSTRNIGCLLLSLFS